MLLIKNVGKLSYTIRVRFPICLHSPLIHAINNVLNLTQERKNGALFSRFLLKVHAIGMLIAVCVTINRKVNKNPNSIQEASETEFSIFDNL